MRSTVLILVLTSYVCGAWPSEDASSTSTLTPDSLSEFLVGNRKFTGQVYKEISKSRKGNFFFSPLSAETILGLLDVGAKAETSDELIKGLSLPNTKERVQKAFNLVLPGLERSSDDLKLLSANKIFVGHDVKLEDKFKTIATDVFRAGVDNVNFSESAETADKINKWVESKTNDKIKGLINPDNLDSYTKMVLVNALYFSGKWAYQFEEYETSKKKFYRSASDIVNVDMMHQVEYLNYYENKNLNAKFLELPYRGGNISMVIVLPNEKEGLTRLEQNVELLLEPQPFARERVDVELPKFTIETKVEFVPILKSLGINRIFDANTAQLSGLSFTDKELFVSDVIQKAFINVTESGTEAAAATAVLTTTLSLPPPIDTQFKADHSFLYYVKNQEIVLFAGRFKANEIGAKLKNKYK